MPTREGRSARRRPRTAPDLSPESDLSEHGTTTSSTRTAGANRVSRGRRSGETSSSSGPIAVANMPEPELLSRFIPPDPWVGRVSLSPQAPPVPAGVVPHGSTSSHPVANGGGESVSSGVASVGARSVGENAAQGIVGLRNEGNWCYLNATLQALARCTPFRAHLVECVSRPDIAGRPCQLAYSMSELYKDMWSSEEDGKQAEIAADVLRALVKGNRWFAGNGQHDAHEALRSLLDLLHEELRHPVPSLFEPGHTALTAALAAASSSQTACSNGSGQSLARASTPSADGNLNSKSSGGKATTPSTPAEGGWSGDVSGSNGTGAGDKRSDSRVTSGGQNGAQSDVYWQSTTTESFQGILLSRITCRACGRHSDQPDRFYDLSVPLLAASSSSVPSMPPSSSTSPSLSASPYPPQPHPPPHSAAAGGPRRTDSEHSTVSPMAPDSVTVEGPRPEWEPSRPHDLSDTRQRATNSGVGGARNISFTDGADSEVDRGMEWSWRRQKPGWCLASDERDARGGFGVDGSSSSRHSRAGTRGAGGSSRSRYMGGWMSSFGVWLGIKSVTLEDCMHGFFSAERLRGTNQYHCDRCGSKREADKSMSLLHAPEILVIHVKRFRRGYFWSHKVYNRVTFPLQDLDVSPWMMDSTTVGEHKTDSRMFSTGGGPSMGGAQNHKNPHVAGVGGRSSRSGVQESSSSGHVGPPPRILYDLVAVVQHTGGLEHGHYTCFARDDGSGEYRGERGSGSSASTWYHFNDTAASKVSQETVASAIPYILVYRRKRHQVSARAGSVRLDSIRGAGAAAAAVAAGGAGAGREGISSIGKIGPAYSGAGPSAASTSSAISTSVSILASAGIGPAAEEARDVRSRVELMARDMAKAKQKGHRSGPVSGADAGGGHGAPGGVGVDVGEGPSRNSISGGISDTEGEGGGAASRTSLTRRRKGRGRRPGSESESEGGAGSMSWVYMSKAWALKWATSAYPGPVSNHHVVCRHGRVKPNVGVKRAVKEVVAVPRGVHRSLVNRYGPRTPAIAGKSATGEVVGGFRAGGGAGSCGAGATATAVANLGRNGGLAGGLPLVGSSRPLLELSSCTACAALEDEVARIKNSEQSEVARLSVAGQDRRRRRKAQEKNEVGSGMTASKPMSALESQDGTNVGRSRVLGRGKKRAGGRLDERDSADGSDGERLREGGEDSSERDGSRGGSRSRLEHRAGREERNGGREWGERGREAHEDEGGEACDKEEWFLMAASWLKRWQGYVLSGVLEDLDFPTPPPGPITNGDLIDAGGKPFLGKEAGKHYRGAVKEVWEFLHERYGGGPVIRRTDPCGLYEDGQGESRRRCNTDDINSNTNA